MVRLELRVAIDLWKRYRGEMTVEAIKRAIMELPEPDLHELETWLENIHGEEVHEWINEGLEQLNKGQGISGNVSREHLQARKATWLASQPAR